MSSTDNVTPGSSENPKPDWYATLPGYPEITVIVVPIAQDRCHIEYSGWADDLIAARLMLAPWLTPTGKHLCDPDDGRKVSIVRQWREAEGSQPRRYCVVRRERRLTELSRWPGAGEALEASRKYTAWDRARRPWAYLETPTSVPRPRPVLRLVVDNTPPDFDARNGKL
jgi:hypothetical protein